MPACLHSLRNHSVNAPPLEASGFGDGGGARNDEDTRSLEGVKHIIARQTEMPMRATSYLCRWREWYYCIHFW